MGARTAQIGENFVVLLWPQDIDNTASEVHLFSTEGGIFAYIRSVRQLEGSSPIPFGKDH